jgi:hypothetical protein
MKVAVSVPDEVFAARVRKIPRRRFELILSGIDIVLGR